MSAHEVKCAAIGCTTPAVRVEGEKVNAWAKSAGYECVMNQSDGLTMEYVCPSCVPKMAGALRTLIEMFGKKTGYLYFTTVLKKMQVEG